ncbi:MAG: UDP-N-acetylglucosamine diphosphorylase, partial [Eubacteriales bacterium]|nr:UDP-N-acetylglucosamine diphosphorylase [Eubacteriales bacterium]
IYIFRAEKLFKALEKLNNDNAQGEYYLTDVPLLMLQAGDQVETVMIQDEQQILGVNTLEDLARCNEILLKEDT